MIVRCACVGLMRALVSGYYGFGNAGDEAMLAGLVEGFRAHARGGADGALRRSGGTHAEHGVAAIPRGFSSARAALRKTDLFISGGGGLIQDATSWRSPLYYLGLMRMARRAGVPVACLGQSVGPLTRVGARPGASGVRARGGARSARGAVGGDRTGVGGAARGDRSPGILRFCFRRRRTSRMARRGRRRWSTECGTVAIAVRRLPQGDGGRGREIAEAAVKACRASSFGLCWCRCSSRRMWSWQRKWRPRTRWSGASASPPAREMLALVGGFDLGGGDAVARADSGGPGGRPVVGISYDPKVDGLLAALELAAAARPQAFSPEQLDAAVERGVARTQRRWHSTSRHVWTPAGGRGREYRVGHAGAGR